MPHTASLALLVVSLVGLPSVLSAAVVIELPEIALLPGRGGQSFDVFAQNSGGPVVVTGIGFNIQVADAGPAAGGTVSGPVITSADIFTGSIFATNNNGPSGVGSIMPQLFERGTLTSAGTVNLPSGLSKVATIVLDTTGFGSGTFALTLHTLNGPTKYTTLGDDCYPILIDGRVTVGARPSITGIDRNGLSRVALTFSTTAGFIYRAQRAPQITAPGWTNVLHALAAGDPLVLEVQKGTGATQTILVESPSGTRVFYRVSMERIEP